MDISLLTTALATGFNLVCAVVNIVMARRSRHRLEEVLIMRETYGRALGFTAFMASEASGSSPGVRDLARRALPPGAVVTVEPLGRVH